MSTSFLQSRNGFYSQLRAWVPESDNQAELAAPSAELRGAIPGEASKLPFSWIMAQGGGSPVAAPAETAVTSRIPADAFASAGAVTALDPSPSIAAPFAAGNLVVYRIGTASNVATAVFLDEYTTAGTFVQTIALPTTDGAGGNQTFTGSGSAATEGFMTLSTDGRYLVMIGYDAAVGTASITTSTSAAVNRVIARVAADGTIDTTTALTNAFSGGNPRSAASTDGQTFWMAGANTGVLTAAFGATTATTVSSTFGNLREVAIFDGQLYVSSQAGALRLGSVGIGTPTTTGQTTTSLPGFPTAAPTLSNAFFFADLDGLAGVDTLYVADDRSVANSGGLQKWSLVSGSWVLNGTANGSLTAGLRGLTGSVSGTTVSFFATDASAQTKLVSLIDSGGYNAAFSATTFTTLVTAGASTAFRSVAFAPQAAAGNPGTLSIADGSVTEGNSGTTQISFTVTRSGGTTGAVSASWNVSFSGNLNDASPSDLAGSLSGTVSFANGETSQEILINVNGDTDVEPNEAFFVTLSPPSGGATLGDAVATGTINDDDAISVTINDRSITEGNAGTSIMQFTVTRTGGSGAFDVSYSTGGGTASDPSDYLGTSGTLSFGVGENSKTISVTINGDPTSEPNETFNVTLSGASNGAIIADATGVGTITNDDFSLTFIHDIQGTSYWSPILAGDGITAYNTASTTTVTIRAVVTALDGVGSRQGFYLTEENADWDSNLFTSEGIFLMTRNDASVGSTLAAAAPGVAVGDIVTITAQVMEYQAFANMPRTMLVNASSIVIQSTANTLPTLTITSAPNSIMTAVTPDYTDSSDGAGDSFDASLYALSFWETVEGMLVTIPNMVVADGNVGSSGVRPYLQAYSTTLANPEQINSRGGYTIGGDPPNSPPNSANPNDGTTQGGRHIHDGDVNPDIIEVDFTDFATAPPAALANGASMGDRLGDLTGIIDFDFEDRKLFVTSVGGTGFVDSGAPAQEVTSFGNDIRSLTVATFNVENLGGSAAQSRFDAIALAIRDNLKSPDIICVEEIQDNNATTNDGTTDASTTWGKLVTALNLATGKTYQWVDQAPVNNSDGGATGGNIRVGFLYDTGRVQLGDLGASATLTERRQYTDRIGDGLRDAGDLISFDDSMLGSEIATADWTTTRKSLLGEFNFNGNKVFVVANHWPSKLGSGDFWQLNQDITTGNPTNSDWAQRGAIGQDVYAMLHHIETNAANVGLVAGGDFNEFYFNRPLEVVTGYVTTDGAARVGGSRFDNLMVTELTEAERYSYVFDGRSQGLDTILANARMSAVAGYDIVHINTGYNSNGPDPLSDHEPSVATFDFRNYAEVLNGTAGADSIDGFGGNDTINGLGGADLLDGGAGADMMAGGSGNDIYVVDNANDVIFEIAGGGAADLILTSVSYALAAGSHVEILRTTNDAGTDALNLTGNEVANDIYGNAGANVLNGGTGADYMYGFGGNDTFHVDHGNDVIFEMAGEGTADQAFASVSYVLHAGSQVEILRTISDTGEDAINLTGNELANDIYGNATTNVLTGGAGADNMYGLGGNDWYYVDNANDVIFEIAGEGAADLIRTSVSYALAASSHVEILRTNNDAGTDALNLTGNEVANDIYGNAGANVLNGGTGADYMYGFGGNDTFHVDHANDVIFEMAGEGTADQAFASVSYVLHAGSQVEILSTSNDAGTDAINLTGNELDQSISGNAGNNVLDGKGGGDSLLGMAGQDIFLFSIAPGGGNVDTILDFTAADDTIALYQPVFAALATGTLAANAFVVGTQAQDADDRIIYDQATGALFYDSDGSGATAAVQFASVGAGLSLSANDFIVI